MTTTIELVNPFPEWELPKAWSWVEASLPFLADDFALRSTDALIERARQIDASGGKTFGVLRDGKLCAWLSFEPVNEVSGVAHCFFARWAWGRKTTDTAVKLFLAEVFGLGFERVSCPALAGNWRIRGLMKRVGIREEGVLRSFTKCGGKLADMLMAGITKADFENGFTDRVGRSSGRIEQYESGADGNDLEHRDEFDGGVIDANIHNRTDTASERDASGARAGNDVRAGHDRGGNDRDGLNQPDVQGDRGPAAAKPKPKRVRKQRGKRHGSGAN